MPRSAVLVAAAATYALALTMLTVITPLVLVRAGYGLEQVGVLVGLSAVAQLGSRLRLGVLLARVPDRVVVAFAALLLAGGSGLLAWQTTGVAVVLSMVLQGASRGLFWTGVQLHAVQSTSVAVRGIADLNLAAGAGQVLGPVLAGTLLVIGPDVALIAVAGAGSVVALLALVGLRRFAPVIPDDRREWRRVRGSPGIRAAARAAVGAGLWRALMGSYLPLLLSHAGHPDEQVGLMIAVANLAAIVGSLAVRRVSSTRLRSLVTVGMMVTGATLGAASLAADSAVGVTLLLAAAATWIGVLQTAGPALAVGSVAPDLRGEALAYLGVVRALALLVAPVGVAGTLLVLSLPAGLALAGATLSVSELLSVRRRASRDAEQAMDRDGDVG